MSDNLSSPVQRSLNGSKRVSVVIPCYNEQEVLPLLIDRLTGVLATWPFEVEVVFVDDGSTDATWRLLTEYQCKDARFKIIRLARNFGHQLALWEGLQHAGGDLVAVLDADLQDPPESLRAFFKKWEQGFDVIYGVRCKRKEAWYKRLAYYSFYRILNSLAEFDLPLDAGDFCLMDRQVVDTILRSPEQQPYIRGIRAWAGFSQTAVEYERAARAAGEVKYTFRKLLQLACNGIFSSSIKPLRLTTYLGLLVSSVSFLGALFTLVQRLLASYFEDMGLAPVSGYATIVIAMLFLGGVQLICLGILGEYVGRIYENVKARPRTVVWQTAGFDGNSSHFPASSQPSRASMPWQYYTDASAGSKEVA